MKGDFTRVTYRPEKGYSKVLMQQGRVTVDADWNEEAEIRETREVATNTDVIGRTGAPKRDGGFEVVVIDEGAGLAVTPGRFYVDGILCEAFASPVTATQFPGPGVIAVPAWNVDGSDYAIGQWLQARWGPAPGDRQFVKVTAATPTTRRITVAPALPGAATAAGRVEIRRLISLFGTPFPRDPTGWLTPTEGRVDLVFLDVWQRHVTFLEDPDIRDPALGGPDTATRVQTVWQLRVLTNVGDADCDGVHTGWDTVTGGSAGRLTNGVSPVQEPTDPCEPVSGGGFNGLENRLYRVEIHGGGNIGNTAASATFKWCRDNGTVAFAVERFVEGEARKVVLRRLGRDEVLTIHPGDWVEVLDDKSEFDGTVGFIARVQRVLEGDRMVELDADIPAGQFDAERHARVRRWDQKRDVTAGGVVRARSGDIELEDGVLVRFSGSQLRTGDYWLFSARTATRNVDPLHEALPHGTRHHFVKLATVTWAAAGTVWAGTVHDCRSKFPSLTEIAAEDVSFDDSRCELAADTVQEALDALCYHVRVLRYVGGDGQEGTPNEFLAAPLAVGVEDEHGDPVANVPVRFTVEPFGATTPGGLRAHGSAATPAASVDVLSGANGIAAVDWKMPPPATPSGTYTVHAELVGPLPADQGSALTLDFHATMQPEETATWPTVNEVDWAASHDRLMSRSRFNQGLVVTFSEKMHKASARPELFQVVVEEPVVGLAAGFKGHRPLVIPGTVLAFQGSPAEGYLKWKFSPTPELTSATLVDWLNVEKEVSGRKSILCRVVLKGDAILDASGQRSLDGDALNRPSTDPHDDLNGDGVPDVLMLDLPSGDGVEGGDFESWFYLVPDVRTRTGLPTGGTTGTVVPGTGTPGAGTVETGTVVPGGH